MNEQITTTDDRVQEIADLTGETPDQVLTEAGQYAARDGISVDEVLTEGVVELEIQEFLEDEDDDSDEDDEDDESDDL